MASPAVNRDRVASTASYEGFSATPVLGPEAIAAALARVALARSRTPPPEGLGGRVVLASEMMGASATYVDPRIPIEAALPTLRQILMLTRQPKLQEVASFKHTMIEEGLCDDEGFDAILGTLQSRDPNAAVPLIQALPRRERHEILRKEFVKACLECLKEYQAHSEIMALFYLKSSSPRRQDAETVVRNRVTEIRRVQAERQLATERHVKLLGEDMDDTVEAAMDAEVAAEDTKVKCAAELEKQQTEALLLCLTAICNGELDEQDGFRPAALSPTGADMECFLRGSDSLRDALVRFKAENAGVAVRETYATYARIGHVDVKRLILGDASQERRLYQTLVALGAVHRDGSERSLKHKKLKNIHLLGMLKDSLEFTLCQTVVASRLVWVARPSLVSLARLIYANRSRMLTPAAAHMVPPTTLDAIPEASRGRTHSRSLSGRSLSGSRGSPSRSPKSSGFCAYSSSPAVRAQDAPHRAISPFTLGPPAVPVEAPGVRKTEKGDTTSLV
ncbi:MAG: hypothetical protein SP1CHLAM54_01970 [Chlamydiia bacterium]|nr:hypothetical protein [Chlamydiia bacterium]MCH9615115.1 hypothetical protein [Chlamydiia bacterium]MCH9628563.1 hypothetical protein [Chlamydiia bacterium]